jgi:serine/threonine-protein kinase SRPK3
MRLPCLSAPTHILKILHGPKCINLLAVRKFSYPVLIRRALGGIQHCSQMTYIPFGFDQIEDLQLYNPGGMHPVSIGDSMDQGRYRLVHKLGNGFDTVTWLARDLQWEDGSNSKGPLVAIKILEASDPSVHSQPPKEMRIAQAFQALAADRGREDIRSQLLSIHSSFTEVGPNGTHACLVSSIAGPNLHWVRSFAKGEIRSDLARKVCRQVTEALSIIHASGYVHRGAYSCVRSLSDGMLNSADQISNLRMFSSA